MKKSTKFLRMLMISIVSLALMFTLLACEGFMDGVKFIEDSGAFPFVHGTNDTSITTISGEVKGTGDFTHDIPGVHVGEDKFVVCSDESTDYKMVISNPEPSAATQVAGSLPKGQYSYRLDAYVVEYPIKDNTTVCDYDVNPSDERVDEQITGTYTPSTYKFTVLSCGSGWDLGESVIYHTTENKISGNIVCERGQGQEKLALKFTDMVLSGMLPTVEP